ncbi:hypothetical protein [Streptomyces sp.]|uniref:hypothetical protein n=1 Tax=Streptomyces sp. TaxID=1931 RepID=UPI002F3F4158
MNSTPLAARNRQALEARLWANIGALSGMGFGDTDQDTTGGSRTATTAQTATAKAPAHSTPRNPVHTIGTPAPLRGAA